MKEKFLGKWHLFLAGGLIFLLAGMLCAGTLVTVETEKARLTIELLERLVQLEKHFRKKKVLKVLILAPKAKTAFQDQNLVNETVIETFRQSTLFDCQVVKTKEEALSALKKGPYDILYIAGLVPSIKKLLALSEKHKIFTVSHLTELVSLGVTLSLDLERRRASIVANKESWTQLELQLPPSITKKITFVSGTL